MGCRRKKNEDVCLVDNERQYYLVADGVGGSAAGEIASRIFLESSRAIFESTAVGVDETVANCFNHAHQTLQAMAAANAEYKGMGCTAELLAINESRAVIGHVGDSRTYLFRNGQLKLLTNDHSFVFEQVKEGFITPEQARTHRMRNVILRAVGVEEHLDTDFIHCDLQTDDMLLLCTDGLTDMVDDQRISDVLSGEGNIQRKTEQLIVDANIAGGKDNITVVLVEVAG